MKFLIVSLALMSSSAFAQWSSSFSTRIHNKLSIGGHLCKGGERAMNMNETICQKGQWLVSVDNINTCSNQGWCTEVAAPSFVADLERADVITITTVSFYDIVPAEKVHKDVAKILKAYWVRDNLNGRATVVKKSR